VLKFWCPITENAPSPNPNQTAKISPSLPRHCDDGKRARFIFCCAAAHPSLPHRPPHPLRPRPSRSAGAGVDFSHRRPPLRAPVLPFAGHKSRRLRPAAPPPTKRPSSWTPHGQGGRPRRPPVRLAVPWDWWSFPAMELHGTTWCPAQGGTTVHLGDGRRRGCAEEDLAVASPGCMPATTSPACCRRRRPHPWICCSPRHPPLRRLLPPQPAPARELPLPLLHHVLLQIPILSITLN
jgi:hypothetical protein